VIEGAERQFQERDLRARRVLARKIQDLDGGDAAEDLEEADPQQDLVHGGVPARGCGRQVKT
jgi:hypothetical protein